MSWICISEWNLVCSSIASAQTFITTCFFDPPPTFQDQPNLIASERKIDRVKVCGEPDVFSHLYTDHMTCEYDKHHFLFEGVTQELRDYAYVLPGTQKHWILSLRQNWACLCRGFHASCRSPICSGCSWSSPSLVGMLPNVGARVQGERTAHRHVELHRDLGRKGGLEKSKSLRISVCFLGMWSEMRLIPTLFYSLLHLCFLIFFHRIWCSPESYSRSTRHIHSDWRGSHCELLVWNKLEQLQHFLV